MEFDNLDSRPGKSWNFGPGHGKSWNLILANMYAAYCSGVVFMSVGIPYDGHIRPGAQDVYSCEKGQKV